MSITLNQHRAGITQSVIALFSDDKTPLEGLSAFFPVKTTADKQVSIEVQRNRQLIAVDVNRHDASRNTFSKSTEKIFVPPYFNEFFDFTSTERYDVTFATIMAGANPNVYDLQALIRSGVDYAVALKNKIARTKELQRAQVLQSGVVQLKNGDNIDFKRQAASLVQKTGAGVWSAFTTADPISDLKAGCVFLRQQGLSTGNVVNVIMGSDAFTNFLANQNVQNQAKFFNQINRTDIGMPQMDTVTGFVFQGRIAAGDYQLNIWTYIGEYENADGSKSPYINANNVVMLPADFIGFTAHAGVPSIMGNAATGLVVAPTQGEYYVRDVIDQVKLTWQFFVSSAPLALPVSIDRIYTITTT